MTARDIITMAEDRAEGVRRFFAQPCTFTVAAAVPDHFLAVKPDLPEVAFWGRSNVGKSSLINAVTGRHGLARASNTAGRTQQIVFFNMADTLMFADLPGYGHAEAPKGEIARWEALIRYYLQNRRALRCVLLLIDARHGVKKIDHEMMTLLDRAAINYQVVMTKADQVRGKQQDEVLITACRAALKKHPAARPEPLLTSAEKGQGVSELRAFIADLAF